MNILHQALTGGAHVRRLLSTRPGLTALTVGIIAIGVGLTCAIFSVVNAVIWRPLPYPNADRLVSVGHRASRVELSQTGVSNGIYLYYLKQADLFEDFGTYQERQATFVGHGDPERIRVALVSPSALTTVEARPFVGRLLHITDFQQNVGNGIVLSHELWTRRFGADPGILGQVVEVERFPPLTVVGVANPGFVFPRYGIQAWIASPPEAMADKGKASVRNLMISTVARLKRGVTPAMASQKLAALQPSFPAVFSDITAEQLSQLGLQPTVIPFRDVIVGSVQTPLVLLGLASGLLLAVTWANSLTLAMVRAEALRGEVAVLSSLGASSRDVFLRFASESIAIAGLSSALAYGVSKFAIETRFGFPPEAIPRSNELSVDFSTFLIVAGLSLAIAFTLALTSFMTCQRTSVAEALRGAGSRVFGGTRSQSARRVLVTIQVAMTVPLIVGSALMAQTFWSLTGLPLGFDGSGIVTFTVPVPTTKSSGDYYHDVARTHDSILRGLRALPGMSAVEAATMFPFTPRDGATEFRIAVADGPGDRQAYSRLSYATPGYFETMHIPLVGGRRFETSDMTVDTPGVILSETLAKTLFANEDAVGKRIKWASAVTRWADNKPYPPYTVVGVVGDTPISSLQQRNTNIFYFPHVYPVPVPVVTGVISDHVPDTQVYVVRTDLPLASVAPSVRQVVAGVNSRLVVTNFETVKDRVDSAYARPRLIMLLLTVAAVAALGLALSGLYGVLSYTVARRTNELAVRMALGASSRAASWIILREGMTIGIAGVIVGSSVTLVFTSVIRAILYQVTATDPLTFAVAGVFVLFTVLLATLWPTHRVTRIDPVRALRGSW